MSYFKRIIIEDSDGNEITLPYLKGEIAESLLEDILKELKIANTQLSLITDTIIRKEEIE